LKCFIDVSQNTWIWLAFGDFLSHNFSQHYSTMACEVGLYCTSWLTLTHQVAFYGCVLYFARWPDTLELRRDPETGKQVRRDHRGCTHSCFFVFFLIFIALFAGTAGISYLVSQHIVLPSFLLQEALAAFLGIVIGVVSHIVADSLTTQKVKVLWPDEESYGLGLFSNERPGEYVVLWGFIFLVGVFVGLGWFGI